MISLSTPLLIGIYKDNSLIKSISSEEKSSEAIPKIFDKLLKEFTCKKVFFAKGPGSFMAIKITYIFLRTLSITKNIELFATDAFYFNNNQPIKAMKKLYFVKENDKIATKFFAEDVEAKFELPKNIKIEDYSQDIEPLYILPAV